MSIRRIKSTLPEVRLRYSSLAYKFFDSLHILCAWSIHHQTCNMISLSISIHYSIKEVFCLLPYATRHVIFSSMWFPPFWRRFHPNPPPLSFLMCNLHFIMNVLLCIRSPTTLPRWFSFYQPSFRTCYASMSYNLFFWKRITNWNCLHNSLMSFQKLALLTTCFQINKALAPLKIPTTCSTRLLFEIRTVSNSQGKLPCNKLKTKDSPTCTWHASYVHLTNFMWRW